MNFLLHYLTVLLVYFVVGFISVINTVELGWYPKKKIATSVVFYAVHNSQELSRPVLYIATASLLSPFVKGKLNSLTIRLHKWEKSQMRQFNVARVRMPPSNVLFPLNLSLAYHKEHIILCWQETDLGTVETYIKYVESKDGGKHFSKIKTFHGKKGKIYLLPVLKVDQKGRFSLFYQRKLSNNRFTLEQAVYKSSGFKPYTLIVKDIRSASYGVFFPSIVMQNKTIRVFFQDKLKNNHQDDLFYAHSDNRGYSYDNADSLTKDSLQDLVPNAIMIKNNYEWVWQKQDGESSDIYYAGDKVLPVKITSLKSPSYHPSINYTDSVGRVIVWHDFRVNPPQIYASFFDKTEISRLKKPHNVSQSRWLAEEPQLINWNKNLYLFYLTKQSLYMRQVDSIASPIRITSSTHRFSVPSRRRTGFFRLAFGFEPSGIASVAWAQDKKPDTVPLLYNILGATNHITLTNITPGNYYLHVRYKDRAGNESPTSHYHFILDTTVPSKPIIQSDTHLHATVSIEKDAKFRFYSEDDSGVKYYSYAFSPNRSAPLSKRTENGELKFLDLEPGIYYLQIHATDFADNKSKRAVHKVIVESVDYSLIVDTNIANSQLKEDNLQINTVDTKDYQVDSIYYAIGTDKIDPFEKGIQIDFTEEHNYKSSSIPLDKFRKKRLYLLSLGYISKKNKKSNIKYFPFEYIGSQWSPRTVARPTVEETSIVEEAPIAEEAPAESAITNIPIEREVQVPTPQYSQTSVTITPTIDVSRINEKHSIYKVQFSIPANYRRHLRGYFWHLTDLPLVPSDIHKINSNGGPEYIYNLEPGIYYLSVMPLLKNRHRYLSSSYSYVRLVVKNTSFFSKFKLYFLLSLIGSLVVLAVYYRNLVYFYLSALRQNTLSRKR